MNKTNKQNTTRDMEIKNKLTVTRGEKGEDGGGRMGRVKSRNTYEGPMDKDNRGVDCKREEGVGRAGESDGGKWDNCK